MTISVEQIRAARAMLGLKQAELAEVAGISTGTLNNIERGVQTDPKLSTMRAIQQALESRGIVFIDNDIIGVGMRAKGRTGEAAKLLIIDDSSSDRKLYRAWLSKEDKKYTVFEASDAQEGYEAFARYQPDCIILDFMMYGKNGFQMLVEMKQEHAHVPPIIFVTATHAETLKKDVMALGVHTYLDKKNLTKEQLCAAVESALGR